MDPESSLPCSHHSPLIPISSQMHPVHTFTPYFPKIQSNIILPSTFFWVVSSFQVSRPTFCIHFLYLPCVLHAPSN